MRTLVTLLKIAALGLAWLFVLPFALFAKRPRLSTTVLAIGAVAFFALRFASCAPHLRIATFNIERFGEAGTDIPKLTSLVTSLDADVIAVQEIQSEPKLRDLAASLSRGSRAYRVALSECGGRSKMRVGFLYDERRIALVSTKEYPELALGDAAGCGSERPGLLGVFRDGPRTFHLLAVHFAATGDALDKRKKQWDRAHAIVAKLRADGATSVAILGDVNSTGYRDDANGERTFVDARARGAGMSVVTSDLSCSAYYEKDGALAASLLDHAVTTPGFATSGSARVHGYCATLRCAPSPSRRPDDFASVSDHCPVTFDVGVP